MRIALCRAMQMPDVLTNALGVHSSGLSVRGISTDSREVQAGDLFVALRGERTDGAAFTAEAFSRGAVAVLAGRGSSLPAGFPTLTVEDPVKALLRAAGLRRAVSHAFLVAISGSTGKTTVKEAVAVLLAEHGSVACSQGNFNSSVGFPLSLLSFEERDFWVVELGISHVGEMAPMARAAAPDLAVLTNVGNAHIGHYRDRDQLLREKAGIAAHLRPDGLLLLPSDLPTAAFPCGRGRMRRFGPGGEFYLEKITMDKNGVRGDLITPDRGITDLTWSIGGRVGRATLETVSGVGVMAGLSEAELRRGLAKAGAKTPRMTVFRAGDRSLIDDSYNASPEAVLGALEVLALYAEGAPTVAVLGDMLELGEREVALHRMVGEAVVGGGVSLLFTYGPRALEIARGALRRGMPAGAIFSFGADEREALVEALCRHLPKGAVVLFKGSGKMKLGEIVSAVGGSL